MLQRYFLHITETLRPKMEVMDDIGRELVGI